MDNLKGKSILIGKETGRGRLLVSVLINGQPKTAAIGEFGSVPDTVSRCVPAEGVAHCKIGIDKNGNIVISNLKSENVTYVGGFEIVSKRITNDSVVELGKDRFAVNIDTVLTTASKIVETVVPSAGGSKDSATEYSILPLKVVWDEYHDLLLEIKRKTRNIGHIRSAAPIFTLGAGALATIAKTMGWPESVFILTLCMTIVGLGLMVYSFYKGYMDRSIEKTEEITENFQCRYVCPNPNCHHFMGNQPYNILRQNRKCPFCGCAFTEK